MVVIFSKVIDTVIVLKPCQPLKQSRYTVCFIYACIHSSSDYNLLLLDEEAVAKNWFENAKKRSDGCKITTASKFVFLKCTSAVVIHDCYHFKRALKYKHSHSLVSRAARKLNLVSKDMFSGPRNSTLWGINWFESWKYFENTTWLPKWPSK